MIFMLSLIFGSDYPDGLNYSDIKSHKPDLLDRVKMSATLPINLARGIGMLLMVCRHGSHTN